MSTPAVEYDAAALLDIRTKPSFDHLLCPSSFPYTSVPSSVSLSTLTLTMTFPLPLPLPPPSTNNERSVMCIVALEVAVHVLTRAGWSTSLKLIGKIVIFALFQHKIFVYRLKIFFLICHLLGEREWVAVRAKLLDPPHRLEGPGHIYYFTVVEQGQVKGYIKIGCTTDLPVRRRYWEAHYRKFKLIRRTETAVHFHRQTEYIIHRILRDSNVVMPCLNTSCQKQHEEIFVIEPSVELALNDMIFLVKHFLLLVL
ncbi:hypothetical protein VNI00_016137 [Paramarasmius palmivorus]|uniref:Bacteriophage T5 Orf172 DNA-binding domain-containing protein n=1 Tax=Paramarasmius palmivorus TaxID=297713 RepID=A0AAW0BEG4_9AGAR